MVRAKFYVTSKENGRIQMSPVVDGSEENKSFYKYTPAGSIDLQIVNDEATKQFEIGKYYYVDFTIAS